MKRVLMALGFSAFVGCQCCGCCVGYHARVCPPLPRTVVIDARPPAPPAPTVIRVPDEGK